MGSHSIQSPKQKAYVHFTLELADFAVSYTSLRIQSSSLLVGKSQACRGQGAAEYSDEGNTSYIVKIRSLHTLEAEKLDDYG